MTQRLTRTHGTHNHINYISKPFGIPYTLSFSTLYYHWLWGLLLSVARKMSYLQTGPTNCGDSVIIGY